MLKRRYAILIAGCLLAVGILPSACQPQPATKITQVTPPSDCHLCEFEPIKEK